MVGLRLRHSLRHWCRQCRDDSPHLLAVLLALLAVLCVSNAPTTYAAAPSVQCTLSQLVAGVNCTERFDFGRVTLVITNDIPLDEPCPALPEEEEEGGNTPTPQTRARRILSNRVAGLDIDGTAAIGADADTIACALSATTTWKQLSRFELAGYQSSVLDLTVLLPAASNLKYLLLTDNSLTQVVNSNDVVFPSLEQLNLAGNALSTVPRVFHSMPKLTLVSFYKNRLRALDDAYGNPLSLAPTLNVLNLHTNFLGALPAHAFLNLTALNELYLDNNKLTTIHDDAFVGLTRLTTLSLDNNPLTTLPQRVIHNITTLTTLSIEALQLRTLPARAFARANALTSLDLTANLISNLTSDTFVGLSALEYLDLSANAITALAPGYFSPLTSLNNISLANNLITTLPTDTFAGLTKLLRVNLDRNRITQLPDTLLHAAANLSILGLAENGIGALPSDLLTSHTMLTGVRLQANRIPEVDVTGLTRLLNLVLHQNPLRTLTGVSTLLALRTLNINDHQLDEIDLHDVFHLSNLITLQVAADRGRSATHAAVDRQLYANSAWLREVQANMSGISTLDLRNLAIYDADLALFNETTLSSFGIGWSEMRNESFLQAITPSFNDVVQELFVTHTQIPEIRLPDTIEFGGIHVRNNPVLTSLVIPSDATYVNVSNCPQLQNFTARTVHTLDISGTRIRISPALCVTLGESSLFARNMLSFEHDAATTTALQEMMHRCLHRVQVLDMSDNGWLNRLDTVRAGTGDTIALTSSAVETASGTNLQFRPTIPIITIQRSPITCTLQLASIRTGSSSLSTVVGFSYVCSCSRGFHQAGDRCKPTRPPTLEITLGTVFAVVPLCFYLTRLLFRRRVRFLHEQKELKERLLQAEQADVLALEEARKIGYGEMHPLRRIAHGASGEVWEAEWDGITVALKVLRQNVGFFDAAQRQEFDTEVKFLQRTRHPNVVRFFGAGTTPTGLPFLVLEFVPFGSMRDLLRSDLADVLRKHLRLAFDVASGMAFIHSLDQLHRDLKSGNVLVSNRLRAKISDFGTIRQRLGAEPQPHAAAADVPYSQEVGGQTLQLALTAGVGTPLYMAPEALPGSEYDQKADVFSFGVLLWEIATQRTPDLIEQELPGYQGPMLATLAQLLGDGKRLQFPTKFEVGFPSWFQGLAEQCMHQQPHERPPFTEICHRLTSTSKVQDLHDSML
ncbi:TKL protein kinase [Salpingoeca rosetta]|uniref:TKL protein kinase n=1 Tax=Salpingoeca rosetta (strain ATCC 50818 / BSB-021) TaxID=946362 RepID=F2UP81_SALR5|nr:TKL protein kinase [Salpingoeca rosetta]EGD79436.1 TKL protein kinase [Salpingoeca rosetta]|eukprot:XP_004988917.1 TKL protein kinase [Salpingoeca rosetta]